jgi:hypothetical protein
LFTDPCFRIFFDGRDLCKLLLSERRQAIEGLIGRPKSSAKALSWVRSEQSTKVAPHGFTTAGDLRHALFKGRAVKPATRWPAPHS